MPVPTRPLSPSPESSPPSKKPKLTHPSPPSSHNAPTQRKPLPLYGILPLGNSLSQPSLLPHSLGPYLSQLPHELLLHLLSLLPAQDLSAFSAASKGAFAFALHDPLWKGLYLSRCGAKLSGWRGTWRKTCITLFGRGPPAPLRSPSSNEPADPWPSDTISCRGIFSDVLYQPQLCASLPLHRYFPAQKLNIPRRFCLSLSKAEFDRLYAEANEPVILTHAIDHWPAYSSPNPELRWSLETLARRFPEKDFQAEALRTTLPQYLEYATNCEGEDPPLYLFDSQFASTMRVEGEFCGGRVGSGVQGAAEEGGLFGEDLFELFGAERPDYRWLIAGPSHSGSTHHKDPNATSAWNACLTGSKGWVMFPPGCTPPGVLVSEDEAEVEGPLGAAEWLESYWSESWRRYGEGGKERSGAMRLGVQRAGEVVYVPSGWWHLVVNLAPSLAVTQNFVSRHELHKVLKFMRDKPGQVSGFKKPRSTCSDTCAAGEEEECGEEEGDEVDLYRAGLYERFVALLREHRPELLEEALRKLPPVPKKGKDIAKPGQRASEGAGQSDGEGKAKAKAVGVEKGMGFSFDFAGEELELEAEAE